MRIHDAIKGKTVEMVATDGQWLMIYTKGGQRFRIGWRDTTGELFPGNPTLEGVDQILEIQIPALEGLARL